MEKRRERESEKEKEKKKYKVIKWLSWNISVGILPIKEFTSKTLLKDKKER